MSEEIPRERLKLLNPVWPHHPLGPPLRSFVSGNVFIRRNQLDDGQVVEGHKHKFDHTTIVFTGAVRVATREPESKVQEFVAPAHFLVRAGVEHEIVATKPGTEFWCVYSLRDQNGDVTESFEKFDGWGACYK